jgi:AcrR family transcriptional regulator
MNCGTSTDAEIQELADTLLADARAGTARAGISALAERAGVTRPTLYRNHPVVVERFRAATAASRTPAAPSAPTAAQELRERNTKLRQENERLRLHVKLYEEHVRRLTVDNTRLANELAARSGVADLSTHRPRHAGEP